MKTWMTLGLALCSGAVLAQEPREPGGEAPSANVHAAPAATALRDAGHLAPVAARLPDGGVAPSTSAPGKPAAPAKVLSRDTIREVMSSHLEQVQTCYEDSLSSKYGKAAKGMAGQIVTSFVIDKKGHVKNAGISKEGTTVKDRKFWHCVTEMLRTLEFPPPAKGKQQPVQFPYKLTVKS